ncbi:MAG: hypothetical protein HY088_08170 [Ignavibacteriales bacterium]|nr:hypothetical protein [Ignavibacteriales bacterium]
MKTFIVTIGIVTLLVPLVVFAQTQSLNLIKNGDFEKFNGNDPLNWDTGNVPGLLTVVTPTKTAANGSSAVKCEVKDLSGTKIAGMISQKKIAISGKELQFSLSYILKSIGGDVGLIMINFQNADGSNIATTEEHLTISKSDFSTFATTLKIPNGALAIGIRLALLGNSGSGSVHEGSYVIFDDVKLIPVLSKDKAPI